MRVLYHGVSVYQVLCCIVHRLAYHEREEAVLMISEHYAPKPERLHFIKNLKHLQIFDEVLVVPEASFKKKRGGKLDENSHSSQIEMVIKNICREFERWAPEIRSFDKIYIASDNWSLGIYCLWNKIPYYYFEDACGMLTDLERYYEIIQSTDMDNYIISKYLHGAGQSKLALTLYCNVEYQKGSICDDRIENFSISSILSEKIPDKVPTILKIYDSEPYKKNVAKDIVLFLTQFIRSLTVKDLNMQREMTAVLLDYFAKDAVIAFKSHPKDTFINYRQLGKNNEIISRNLPSELLPFLFPGQLKAAITASSTSIRGLGTLAREYYSFSPDIEENYLYLHTAYAIVKLIEAFGKEYKIQINMKESIYLENFLKFYKIQSKEDSSLTTKSEDEVEKLKVSRDRKIFIETDGERRHRQVDIREMEEGDIAIFDNCEDKYSVCLLYTEELEKFFVWNLRVRGEREDYFSYQKQIWVYCKGEKQREKLEKLKMIRKKLRFSNQIVEIWGQSVDEQMRLDAKRRALEYKLRVETKKEGKQQLDEDEIIENFYYQRNFKQNFIRSKRNANFWNEEVYDVDREKILV